MMDHIVFDRSETYTNAPPPARALRKFLWRSLFLLCFLAACSLLILEATEPLARPDACISCHEMKPVHDRWAKSPHHSNPSGVKVTCIACHLPPRKDYFGHVAGRVWKGTTHGWKHWFGQYDETAVRRCVLDNLPNDRCTYCHDNLAAKPSTPAVGAVHAWSLQEPDDNRLHACVACHDHLHTPTKPPEKKSYDTADNSFCFDCHVNFKKEPFVVRHMNVNVGCVDCHGESLPHADDEEHTAAPSIMYTKAEVNDSCMGCHEEDDVKKNRNHKAWFIQADAAAKALAAAKAASRPHADTRKRKYCTDCHGMHRIDERQRKWDKKTKKLIWSGGHDIDPNAEPETKPAEERM